jgi:hypothetical protein
MTRFRLSIFVVALLVGVSISFAQATKTKRRGGAVHRKHIVVTPDQIKWGPAPPGLPPGSELAVLSGDPSKAGVAFTMRAKLPDGYKIPPHWHPTDENVSVVQGTLMIGMGNRFDEKAAMELPAGSYALLPKVSSHFAWAKGETIIDVYGIGPFAITYVNPSDDPRRKIK